MDPVLYFSSQTIRGPRPLRKHWRLSDTWLIQYGGAALWMSGFFFFYTDGSRVFVDASGEQRDGSAAQSASRCALSRSLWISLLCCCCLCKVAVGLTFFACALTYARSFHRPFKVSRKKAKLLRNKPAVSSLQLKTKARVGWNEAAYLCGLNWTH